MSRTSQALRLSEVVVHSAPLQNHLALHPAHRRLSNLHVEEGEVRSSAWRGQQPVRLPTGECGR